MRLEATVQQIRALLRLVELTAGADEGKVETGRRGHEAVGRLPRRLLERYQSLLDAGRTPAVVAIERGVCSGCHIRLPTMVEAQARSFPALHTCPRCRRMLYAPELVHEGFPAADVKPSRSAPPSAGKRS